MKRLITVCLFILVIGSTYAQKPKSIFDKYITSFDVPEASIYVYGFPDVTLNVNDLIIRSWNHQPLAYLYFDPIDVSTGLIYGFNGKHLGWYFEGSFYNNSGKLIGNLFSKWRKMHIDRINPSSTISYSIPSKRDRETPRIRPSYSSLWESEDDQLLSKYLVMGIW